jgi:Tfp pilus assembly protein PilF
LQLFRLRRAAFLNTGAFMTDQRLVTPPHRKIVALLLFAVTLGVYAQVVGFDFVSYDDPDYVTANPHVTTAFTREGVVWALSNHFNGNWQPLTWLSHMLDSAVFGGWAGGHHLVSALLHAINAALLFLVLATATGAHWRSATVAALFALHPLHVESVAWISERKDVLSACFALLSTWAYVQFTRERRPVFYAATFFCLALGLMAKAMLVTLPCVFLLLDRWPLQRPLSLRLVVEKLPFFALGLFFCGITVMSQHTVGATADGSGLVLAERLANAVVSTVAYLGDTFWPSGLAILHPHPYLLETGGVPLATWQIVGSAALLLVVTAATLLSRRDYAWVGWLWFLGMLIPVLGLVQMGVQGRADRYTYLPHVGLFIVLVWAGADLVARLAGDSELRARSLQRGVAAAAALTLTTCGILSWQQSRHWRDSHALFQHAVAVYPRSPTLQVGLGEVMARTGELAAAESHYRAALAVDPAFPEAHNNLGSVLMARGRADEALAHFQAAVRAEPDVLETQVNLANALAALGRTDEAVVRYDAVLRSEPDSAEAHFNLGNALLTLGELEAAAQHFQAAIRSDPALAQAHVNLGYVLTSKGQLDAAIVQFERALEIRPGYGKAIEALRHTRMARASQGG